MTTVLFVCTGNLFRSVGAEYALRAQLPRRADVCVHSAGTHAAPAELHPLVQQTLLAKGADCSAHAPRRLDAAILADSDIVVPMSTDHQQFLKDEFGLHAPLFNERCHQRTSPILDLPEVIKDYERDETSAQHYIISVLDYIWESVPLLLSDEELMPARAVAK